MWRTLHPIEPRKRPTLLFDQVPHASLPAQSRRTASREVYSRSGRNHPPAAQAEITFPITVKGGPWQKIKSTTALQPGRLIRINAVDTGSIILEKKGKTLQVQDLHDGSIGPLSIYDAKANWEMNTRAGVPRLVKAWRERKV